MKPHSSGRAWLAALAILTVALSGCAGYPLREPIEVYVADIESLPGEGLEVRMMVKLRIQNPNDETIVFDGVALNMDLQGRPFATGVADVRGEVPRYGETLVAVPVSLSVFGIARRAVDAVTDVYQRGRVNYELSGKLARSEERPLYFESDGQFSLPEELYGRFPR
ncbi:MAG TPA: LEA type 2 family protein [Burkholderiales bacterium]|nr:LEA type 2 family protein [Burkholderiales bacterium]